MSAPFAVGIEQVPLSLVRPNPFHDAEAFPLNQANVAKLEASMMAEGFRGALEARKVGGYYEVAYGHHRLEAARRCGVSEVPLLVAPLSDADMISLLYRENQREELGFWYTEVQAIRALVLAAGAGKVQLPPVADGKGARADQVRHAPSFARGGSGPGAATYTADSIAAHLGLLDASHNAPDTVRVALGALEAVEVYGLNPASLAGLGVKAVELAVRAAQHAARVREEQLAAERNVVEAARAKAEEEGDRFKVERYQKQVEALEEKAQPEKLAQAAKAAVTAVTTRLKEGESVRTVAATTATDTAKKAVAAVKKTQREVSNAATADEVEAFTTWCGRQGLESEAWGRLLGGMVASPRLGREAVAEMARMVARLQNRLREAEDRVL